MQRGPRGEKRPADAIGCAVMVGKIATHGGPFTLNGSFVPSNGSNFRDEMPISIKTPVKTAAASSVFFGASFFTYIGTPETPYDAPLNTDHNFGLQPAETIISEIFLPKSAISFVSPNVNISTRKGPNVSRRCFRIACCSGVKSLGAFARLINSSWSSAPFWADWASIRALSSSSLLRFILSAREFSACSFSETKAGRASTFTPNRAAASVASAARALALAISASACFSFTCASSAAAWAWPARSPAWRPAFVASATLIEAPTLYSSKARSFTIPETTTANVARTPNINAPISIQFPQNDTKFAVSGDIPIPAPFLFLLPVIGAFSVIGIVVLVFLLRLRPKGL